MKKKVTFFLFLLIVISTAGVLAAVNPSPGKIPFDYPIVKTTSKAGEWVMTPSKIWLDDAFKKGPDYQTFIFYAATMVAPGNAESKIKTLVNDEVIMPNSMIVPIKKGGKAKPGDIVLTWWQSGSGMNRAIVVKGGTEINPKVMYLDIDYENPAGIGKKVDQLKTDSFCRLTVPGEVGTAVAHKEPDGSYKHGLIINKAGEKLLLLGFAGKMWVANKSTCINIPIKPPVLKAGESVMIPFIGKFRSAKVVKYDPAIGRVFVKFLFGSREKQEAVAFGNVIKKLP